MCAMSEKLTPRQQRFVEEYLVDLNGTRAALRAGYSEASAASQACELLKVPKIARALAEAKAARSERTDISAERVLRELARIAFADPSRAYDDEGKLLSPKDMPEDARAALAGYDVEDGGEKGTTRKVKTWPKVQALELLGKHLGMFTEKVELAGKDGERLSIKIDLGAAKP